MRAILALLLALPLVACGGCGGGGPSPDPAAALDPCAQACTRTVLYQQAAPTAVIHDATNPTQFPRDRGFVATWALGPMQITDDERGVGIINDSWTAPAGTDQIKAANYSWIPSTKVRPWASGAQAWACTSWVGSAPVSERRGGAHTYLGADLWLADSSTGKPTSGRGIIVSGNWFFHDLAIYPDSGPHDYIASLNSVQYRAGLGTSDLITTTAGYLRSQPWSEPQPFGFCISRAQAQAMVTAAAPMVGGVMDLDDVAIDSALISNETAIGAPSSRDPSQPGARLTSYFSDWRITIIQPK